VRALAVVHCLLFSAAACAGIVVSGEVRDVNGNPVPHARVTLFQPPGIDGPEATTVFANNAGHFSFPRPVADELRARVTVEAKALGYRMVFPARQPVKLPTAADGRSIDPLVLVLQPERNHADSAPASAWFRSIPDSDPNKALVVRECVACHQVAHSDMRAFVQSTDDGVASRSHEARKQSWQKLLTYMYGTSHEFFGAAMGFKYSYQLQGAEARYLEPVSEFLVKYLPERLDFVEYEYGAPLAVTPTTEIREYPIPNPPDNPFNAVGTREAVLAGNPLRLWVVDVASDHIYKIDPLTGAQKSLAIPFRGMTGPHSIYTGYDGRIWFTFLFQQLYGTIDPQSDTIEVHQARTPANDYYVSHDFATDWRSKVSADTHGFLWFGDVASNSLGSVDLKSGEARMYPSPEGTQNTASQSKDAAPTVHLDDLYMYGTVMSSDRKHVWYTQLNGRFGEFNTETRQYGTTVDVPFAAGPRRLAITEKDILYVPLFGAGQIVEYDARAHRQLAVYNLPDRASAPYAVTWDSGRQVLWVATANADAIYRFDPKTRAFGVIPLPHQRSYLRMLQVEPETGLLATSTALLPARAPGPRAGLIVDPGDGYTHRHDRKAQSPATAGSPPVPQAPANRVSASELEQLSRADQCVSCHSVKEARIGPPFNAIALRYSGQPRNVTVDVLAAKILTGGAGNWGAFPMPARERLFNVAEARRLAEMILNLDTHTD
jgi:cytochrome c